MAGRPLIALAWALLAAAVGGLVAAASFDSPPYARPPDIFWGASFLAFPIVGLVLAIRLPTNPVGWLFEVGPDAERVVAEFSGRLRDEVELGTLTADWVAVVQETVQPASVSVWVKEAT